MLTLFDNTMTPIMTLSKRVMIEAIETHEINVAKTLEVTVQAKKEILAALENARYAATSIKDSNSRYTMYRLAPYTVDGPQLYITGLEKFYDDMEYMDYIQDYRPTNRTPLDVFAKILEGSDFNINYINPQIENRTISTNFYYISRLESLSKAVEMFGLEIEAFSAIDSKGNVTGNYVNITNKLGKTLNTRYSYGRNTSNVVAEYDPLNVVTSVLGRGKGEENDEGNYGRRIMFTDVVWSKAAGNPLDKPAGENILTDPSSMALNAFGNGKPRLQIVTFEDCETPEELIQLSYDWLIENNRPKVQFKATPIVFDERTAVGDTVTIVRSDLNIIYQTRIFKFTRNLLSPNASIVEFGDKLDKSLSDIQKDFSSALSKQWQQDINASVGGIVVSGSGSNISYGESEPIKKKVGDMWYETYTENGVMKYRLKIWNGTTWEVTISEEMFTALQGQIDTAVSEIEGAVNVANDAVQKADNAISKVTSVESNVGEINGVLTETGEEINGLKNRMTDSEGNISVIKQSTDLLQTAMTNAEGDISGLKQTATSIQTDVADLEGNVSTITQTVDGLNSKVTNIDGTVSQLSQTSNAIVSRVEQLEGGDLAGQNLINDPNIDNYVVGVPTASQKLTKWQIASETTLIEPDTTKPNRKIIYSEAGGTRDSKSPFIVNSDPNGEYTIEFDYRATALRYGGVIAKIQWSESTSSVASYVADIKAKDFATPGTTEELNVWQRRKITFTLPADKIGKGYLAWSTWVSSSAGEYYRDVEIYGNTTGIEAVSSQISQLSDAINLRVAKGDVINQINLSTEGILIAGQKVHITGQTTIDNAVIKDAMIGSVSANKLTAGTIDASKINVINLDAANITANKAQFIEAAWNGISSSVKVTSSGLQIFGKPGEKLIDFNNESLRFYNVDGQALAEIDPETSADMVEGVRPSSLIFRLLKSNGAIVFRNSSNEDTLSFAEFNPYGTIKGWTFDNTNLVCKNTQAYFGTFGVNREFDGTPIIGVGSAYWNTKSGSISVRNSNYEGVALTHGKSTLMGSTHGLYLTTGAVALNGPGNYNFALETAGDGNNIITSDAILKRTYSTIGSHQQVIITSNGIMGAVTSSKRFKLAIEESNSEQFKKILNIKPKTWFDKRESEEKADYLTRLANGEDMTGAINPVVKRTTGAIAEDFVEVGLEEFVIKDDDTGEVNGLAYERAWLYLIPLVKELYERIDVLEKSNM